ncbi:MAG: hypothetical protein V4549_06670 [Bacteroidota bacterium]
MTYSQAATLKRKFIEERQRILKRNVTSLENTLYDAIFNKLIADLDVTDGKIVSNNKNIDLTSALNKIFDTFNKSEYLPLIKAFSKDFQQIQKLNETYFDILAQDKKKLDTVSKQVNSIMEKTIGITNDGKIVSKGYLDRLVTDNTLQSEIKTLTYRAVTGGLPIVDYKDSIKRLVVGSDNVDGALQKHFNTFAYDTYTQFDRTSSKLYAVKLDLKYFIYAGGEINTTRCFCDRNNGKVFSTDEAEEWIRLLNDECGPIWNEKVDGTYDPISDMGGYNCRHTPDYISETIAKKLRPDLEN